MLLLVVAQGSRQAADSLLARQQGGADLTHDTCRQHVGNVSAKTGHVAKICHNQHVGDIPTKLASEQGKF